VVLTADAFYGIVLVVLHAVLLGEVVEPSPSTSGGQQVMPWWLQIADLDLGFGHKLLGISDHSNMVSGLVYGIVVTVFCSYMLLAMSDIHSPSLPAKTRWFTAFAHLQILLFVAITLVKLPKLCHPIQKEYLTHLDMECNVLWSVYVQSVVSIVILLSLGTWIFASFSFTLTYGSGADAAVDRPEYRQSFTGAFRRGPRYQEQGYYMDPENGLSGVLAGVHSPNQYAEHHHGYGRHSSTRSARPITSQGPEVYTQHTRRALPFANGHPNYNLGRLPRHVTTAMAAEFDVENQVYAKPQHSGW